MNLSEQNIKELLDIALTKDKVSDISDSDIGNIDPAQKLTDQKISNNQAKHDLAVLTYGRLFWAICSYVALVLLILFGNSHYFQLDNSVLVTLLGSTTINILGIFFIASRWVYHTK